MAGKKRSMCSDADICGHQKELDEALCPICMDHPHNAVLLFCSSHGKGCRSYICDTSYRHSNCLDRYKKLEMESSSSPPARTQPTTINSNSDRNSGLSSRNEQSHQNHSWSGRNTGASSGGPLNSGEHRSQHNRARLESLRENVMDQEGLVAGTLPASMRLKCPMCRGDVLGWKVVEEARKYLNQKHRSCSHESCSFVGNYSELRRHARSIHPTVRPAEIDPSRQRAWRNFEHQREYDDIVSAIRSAMPGAVVLGDYVIENGDRLPAERDRIPGDISGPMLTTYFLFQMLGSMDSAGERRARARGWTRHRRSAGLVAGRRYPWGENLLGLDYHDDDDDTDDDLAILSNMAVAEDTSPIPRRRRRLTRSRSTSDRDRRGL